MTFKSGVYQIVNETNGKRYVGSAVNLRKRENEHFAHLRRGVHHSLYLQRAYDKQGEDAFRFSVLLYVPPQDCIKVEQWFLDDWSPEYNMSIEASSRLGAPQPESMRKAQSLRMKEKWLSMSQEERNVLNKKRGDALRGHWANRTAEERKAQMAAASEANWRNS